MGAKGEEEEGEGQRRGSRRRAGGPPAPLFAPQLMAMRVKNSVAFKSLLKLTSSSAPRFVDVVGFPSFASTSSSSSSASEANIMDTLLEDEDKFSLICEGKAQIFQPKNVFYNKVQVFNRDLSVLVLNTFLKHEYWKKGKFGSLQAERGIKILDALSATGMRSIRYAKELETPHKLTIVGNDLSANAAEIMRKNVKHNDVQDKVTVVNEDAALFMYLNRKYEDRFVAVDVDPFGSPAPFIDGAVQSVTDGGLVMVTCTDMAILCGNHSETCYARYGSMSLKGVFCHEMALRIILRCIESQANRYGRYTVPLLSVSADFYIRLFVQVFSGPIHCKRSASKTAHVYVCNGCESLTLQPIGRFKEMPDKKHKDKTHVSYTNGFGPTVDKSCQHCGGQHYVGGPVWADSIHSTDFVEKLKVHLEETPEFEQKYQTYKRLEGMLQMISEELPDVPFYQTSDALSRVIHCPSPPQEMLRSALLNGGYRVSYSHAHRNSIKTDAPNDFVWDIMRKWVEEHPVNVEKLDDRNPGKVILQQPVGSDVSFKVHEGVEPLSKEKEMVRFQVNPEPNWGPKARPSDDTIPEKSRDKAKRNKDSSPQSAGTVDKKCKSDSQEMSGEREISDKS